MDTSDYKFKVGDRVCVKRENPLGNPRTPDYVKGKKGMITAAHGVIKNPADHRALYAPLYTVMFEVKEVFGRQTSDNLWVDVHEDWLEKA